MDTIQYALIETLLGAVALVWRRDALVGVRLPAADEAALRASVLRSWAARETALEGAGADAADYVRALLGGEKPDGRAIPVDLPPMDDVSMRALHAARDIAVGETETYGAIARRLGDVSLARRVGQAMSRNPTPLVVPCHRVVGEGGRLVGFSAPGGVAMKLRLLNIEGASKTGLFGALPLVARPAE